MMRTTADAVVVGVGTVIADDPSLRVHREMIPESPVRNPWRVILDSKGRTPAAAKVLDGSQPTIIATSAGSTRAWPEHVQVLRAMGEHVDLRHLLTQLYDLGMRTVMIEGGSKVLASVVRERLFDRLTVFIAPVLVGGTTAPSLMSGPECEGPDGVVALVRTGVQPVDGGVLLTFIPGRHA